MSSKDCVNFGFLFDPVFTNEHEKYYPVQLSFTRWHLI